MTTISKNIWTFYGRLFCIVPLIWLILKPIQNSLNRKMDEFQIGLLAFFLIFVLVLSLFLFIGLFLRPISVTIKNKSRLVITKTLFRITKTISIADIKGYSSTKLRTRFKYYHGITLYLKDNNKIELTEFNLQSLKPIEKFLDDMDINYLGEEISWFPFRPLKFRYDNNT